MTTEHLALRIAAQEKSDLILEINILRDRITTLQDQLRTLRENRFHASSYLDCSERLKIACEALQWLREQGAKVWRRPSVYPQTIGYERSPAEWAIDEAIEKIGEVKSPKQALEKGNG